MNKFLFGFCLSLFSGTLCLKAQVNHFLYFQHEKKQPFYAILEKKVMSSASSGYLIIPKLKDGTYDITIGFPMGEIEEQHYICTVNNKDAGYLIKNLGDKGWGLFNLQTLEVVKANNANKKEETVAVEKSDPFSTMLAEVVNDPTIRQTEKVKEETPQVKNETISDSAMSSTATENANGEAKETVADKSNGSLNTVNTGIVKLFTNSENEGTVITYVDNSSAKPDTIRVFIPLDKVKASGNQNKKSSVTVNKQEAETSETKAQHETSSNKRVESELINNGTNKLEADTTIDKPADEQNKPKAPVDVPDKTEITNNDDKKFLPIELSIKDSTGNKSVDDNLTNKPAQNIGRITNSDCRANANDEDFLKLRKKMAAVNDQDQMISIAKKAFKVKCFTTDQIKNLSVLFLDDAAKYKFFDLAYQYASDSYNFHLLEKQLTDPYYISRFNVMVHR
jgi:hypothetical protein